MKSIFHMEKNGTIVLVIYYCILPPNLTDYNNPHFLKSHNFCEQESGYSLTVSSDSQGCNHRVRVRVSSEGSVEVASASRTPWLLLEFISSGA